MKTFRDIIDQWPSGVALASDLGEQPGTVRSWRLPDRGIPSRHWPRLIEAARRRGIYLTYEMLHGVYQSANEKVA